MNNQFKNKTVGFGTTPKFNKEIFFCVSIDTNPVEIKDYSSQEILQEPQVQMLEENPIWVNSLTKSYEYEILLIQRQNELIKELKNRISNAKVDLFEKEKQIAKLENALEEICEKFLLGMSPS